MIRAWPRILTVLFVVRVIHLLRLGRTQVTAYAIENGDVGGFLAARLHLPMRVGTAVAGWVVRQIAQRLDKLVFGTGDSQNLYKRIVGGDLNSVRTVEIPALAAPCRSCPSTIKMSYRFTFLGALEHRKGFPIFLKAARRLLRLNSQYHVVIAGKGSLEGEATAFAAEFPDSVSTIIDPRPHQIHAVLSLASVCVLFSQPTPTWREQVGLPIVEALSHGCEVVSSTETGLQNWLTANGHRVLPPESSPRMLANAIADACAAARPASAIRATLPAKDGRFMAHNWMMRP